MAGPMTSGPCAVWATATNNGQGRTARRLCPPSALLSRAQPAGGVVHRRGGALRCGRPPLRSEEHTSELQSRGHLVCRLLLEKKNPAFVASLRASYGTMLPPA